jgi:hypothetical protein
MTLEEIYQEVREGIRISQEEGMRNYWISVTWQMKSDSEKIRNNG